MLKTVIFLLLFLSFTNYIFATSCVNWEDHCKNIDHFRENKKKLSESNVNDCNKSINTNILDLPQSQKNIISTLNSSNSNSKFLFCLDEYSNITKKYQQSDIHILREAFIKNGIKEINYNRLVDLFSNPNRSYLKRIQKISQDEVPYVYYRDYTLSGPIENLNSSLSGYKDYSFLKEPFPLIQKYSKSGFEVLNEISDKKKIIKFLFDRASSNLSNHLMITSDPNRQPITPAIAKLILYEIIYEVLQDKPDRLIEILTQLKLKFSYMKPFSLKTEDLIKADNLHSFSLHNGYFLGADFDHLPDKNTLHSSGIDCTLIVQKCLQNAGVSFSNTFKLLSSRLIALGNPELELLYPEIDEYKNIFDVAPYMCEDQLQLGDIIAFNGHAFVFAGYKKNEDSGKLDVLTYEAIAGEYRSFGLQTRELYPEDACAPPVFISSGRVIPANIIRVKKWRY